MATPPDFTAGQVLTAAQMDAVGTWLVKKQTIGTAVSSVNVTSAFSADYDNYRIVISGGASSAATVNLALQLGATVTGYYFAQQQNTYAAVGSAQGGANGSSFTPAGYGSPSFLHMDVTLYNPFAADETVITGFAVFGSTTGVVRFSGGYLNNTTSYTDFTITPSTGTITGGTIYVYGLR